MAVRAVRGATQLEEDTREHMLARVAELESMQVTSWDRGGLHHGGFGADRLFGGAGNDELAVQSLEAVRRTAPGETLVPYYLGLIALKREDNAQALALLQQCLGFFATGKRVARHIAIDLGVGPQGNEVLDVRQREGFDTDEFVLPRQRHRD